jgi:hypothetical protein
MTLSYGMALKRSQNLKVSSEVLLLAAIKARRLRGANETVETDPVGPVRWDGYALAAEVAKAIIRNVMRRRGFCFDDRAFSCPCRKLAPDRLGVP